MKTVLISFILTLGIQVFGQSNSENTYYVSVNASSLIPGKTSYFSYKKFHGLGANQVLSIEPEVKFGNKVNLKLEFAVGLGFVEEGTETHEVIRYSYIYNGSCYLCYSGHGSKTYYQSPVARRNDLIFHIGVSPKFYLSKGKHSSTFIQPTFRMGLMDKYAINTFIRRTVEEGNSPYPPPAPQAYIINELERKNFYNKNPYVFYRGELTFGAELNIANRFSIVPQFGLATMSLGHGKKPDNIYISTNGSDYVLATEQYNNTDVGFDGINLNKEDYYSLKRSRIHGILRVSVRYQLN